MALLSVWKLSFEAFLLVLFSRVCLFVPSDPGQCYSWDIFQHGHLLGNKLRMIENIGPFTCIRECLLRKSCKSIDYLQYYKACEINFDNTSKDNPLEQKLLPWRHLEKSDMYKLLDVSPCNDTVCGVNERCEVLANDSVSCSITGNPITQSGLKKRSKYY
ncbi:uncharacterized protein LOC134283188 [Saccostrea cucullata]|uniref:uncharacterized protein LOC134283188 n=1 Tax=Saccostrea cuccullata TaxID=36930 RepID=UPI002ED2D9D9